MMNVAEGFHFAHSRNAHRTVFANFTDVVAEQIHNHHVLGSVLRAVGEIANECRVFFGRASAWPRALDRPRLDFAIRINTQESFRGSAENLEFAKIEVRTKRRRVKRAQAAEESKR